MSKRIVVTSRPAPRSPWRAAASVLVTLMLIAAGVFASRVSLGRLPDEYLGAVAGSPDIAVLASRPNMKLALRVEADPVLWSLTVIADQSRVQPGDTALIVIPRRYEIGEHFDETPDLDDGVTVGGVQALKAPWLFSAEDVQVIRVPLKNSSRPAITGLPGHSSSYDWSGGRTILIPGVGTPTSYCFQLKAACPREQPIAQIGGQSWFIADSQSNISVNVVFLDEWSVQRTDPPTEGRDELTWSGRGQVNDVRVDLTSVRAQRKSQLWMLVASVLFGVAGGVLSAWILGGGSPQRFEVDIPSDPPPPPAASGTSRKALLLGGAVGVTIASALYARWRPRPR